MPDPIRLPLSGIYTYNVHIFITMNHPDSIIMHSDSTQERTQAQSNGQAAVTASLISKGRFRLRHGNPSESILPFFDRFASQAEIHSVQFVCTSDMWLNGLKTWINCIIGFRSYILSLCARILFDSVFKTGAQFSYAKSKLMFFQIANEKSMCFLHG